MGSGGFMKNLILVLCVAVLTGCSLPLNKPSSYYVARGEMSYKTGNLKKALKDFNTAVQKDNYNVEAYASRGALLFDLKQYETALSDFNIVLQADPNRSEVHSAVGATLAGQGKYKESRESLLKALELNPSNVEALCSLGGVYYSTGNYKSAIEEYTKAIKLRPAPQIYFARAVAYNAYGNIKEAQADFQAAGVEVTYDEQAAQKTETGKAVK